NSKINRFSSEKKKTLTSLIALWICQNIRPISIVEDEGFLNIIQQCLSWNGGPFNNINGNDILPSRSTITREINRQANDIRERLGVILRKGAKQECLAISPDLWSDKFKQNSSLGLTAHFVDDQHILHSIDLCCEPYNEIDKTAGNVLKSITAALSRFGLDQLIDKITFVCDCGSNLRKALEDYQVVHCFPHRLNNVLKRTFYSAGVVFFKRHAPQLLKAMFSLHDLHWIAAILNPHRRMLKHATDVERAHAYCLVQARVAKLMEMAQIDNNEEVLSPATISSTLSPRKKLKSYTTQFHDDTDLGETSSNMIIAKRARRELEIYLQLNLTNCKCLNDDMNNPLLFWKEQEHVLPNMSRLAKQIFSIPASSTALERAFSSV
ncbi:unnamed protein product, partial [Rotaria sp. Silwood1]